ncbi:protein-L-isoaspartate O-methyltransferase [Chytridium lagenaria]|nr:protein-L-isoaspartate O-methyltransferase [Chytridium lagenaria]
MCAWRSHGTSNVTLLQALRGNHLIQTDSVFNAMLKVDRANYVPPECAKPYRDHPVSIGYGATISAPHMHAMCLEILEPWLKPGAKVLDVGSGSGYLAAVMAHMVDGGGVVGVEHVEELVEFAERNVGRERVGGVRFFRGDGRLGFSEEAPFDCIHVGAAAPEIPTALIEQLKPGGRLVIPVGTDTQELLVVDKDVEGEVTMRVKCGVMYVPLTSLEKQVGV